jgi:hypothetical protein
MTNVEEKSLDVQYKNEITARKWWLILLVCGILQAHYLLAFTPDAYLQESRLYLLALGLGRSIFSVWIGWPLAGLASLMRGPKRFTDVNKWTLWFAIAAQLNLIYMEQVHW